MFRSMLLVLPLIIATVHGATIGGTNTDESICASISSSCDADGTYQFGGAGTSYPVYKCATCGFVSSGVIATGNDDCYTCPAGKQLAVRYADCTGYCIDPSNADVFTANSLPTFANSTCTTPGKSYPVNCDEEDDIVCFAGSETLLLESGETVTFSEVQMGDRVQVMDSTGSFKFSEISYLPHKQNEQVAKFVLLETASRSLKASPAHLLVAGECGSKLELTRAEDVAVGACLFTVNGQEQVSASSLVDATGIFTAVTQDPNGIIVVNGVVASSFAVNHWFPNAYYNFHRVMYNILPSWLMKNAAAADVNMAVGNMVNTIL